MKLYCQKCQKVFPVDAGAEPNSNIVCPVCNEPHTVPESHTSPGVVIGDFLIESRLSSGGMGDVFVARQISLDREVALKILQDKFTGDKEYIDGLFYEARAAAKVNHPNVVRHTPWAKRMASTILRWSLSAARPSSRSSRERR